MVVVIDYQMGNPGSIINMFKKIGVQAVISSDFEQISAATKLVLPGVGSFDAGMMNLAAKGLREFLTKLVVEQRKPILGICLGMQLLGKGSEEGKLPGLGWLDFANVRFKFDEQRANGKRLKIPHMGWNSILIKKASPLFKGLEAPRFYFVHSYHALCRNDADVLAETFYGYNFASVVARDNIWGAQFHPEKSHKFGMTLLRNFMECN